VWNDKNDHFAKILHDIIFSFRRFDTEILYGICNKSITCPNSCLWRKVSEMML